MKKIILLITLLICGFSLFAQTKENKTSQLRHVVIFKFKDSSSAEQVQQVANSFADLYGKVPEVKALEWGVNNSPEHYNEGFTHCFILSFNSEKDLASYQQNPAHMAFQKILKPHMEKVFVVDYWTK